MAGRKAVIIFATNKYFILGLRLISHWEKHYKSDSKIDYIFISDSDPGEYYNKKNIYHIPIDNSLSFMDIMIIRWAYAAKIASFGIHDRIITVDADTSINFNFTDEDFSSEFSVLLHPDNDDRNWMLNHSFEKNKMAAGYFKFSKDEVYYNAGFTSMSPAVAADVYNNLIKWYKQDLSNGIEPPWHDETYINKYAHVVRVPKKIIDTKNGFLKLGDKGGKSVMSDPSRSGIFLFENAKVIDDAYTNALASLKNIDIDNNKWDILDGGLTKLV